MNRLVATALVALTACDATTSEDTARSLDEPLVIRGAQFRPGPLPGLPPVEDAPPIDAGTTTTAEVISIESLDRVILPGQVDHRFTGLVTDRAQAVAARLSGVGSGYWTFPVGVADPQTPGAHTWDASVDFAPSLSPGLHPLRLVALDAQGLAGRQRDLQLCVADPLEGLRACGVDAPLPAAAIVLTWSTDVDLDLHVRTPAGKDVSPKHPSTALGDGTTPVVVDPARDGVMSRDSNAGCVVDGLRREQLVWAAYPTQGRYQLRANLAAACGQPSVTFTMSVYVAQGSGADARMVPRFSRGGVLGATYDETPAGAGLLVTDFDF